MTPADDRRAPAAPLEVAIPLAAEELRVEARPSATGRVIVRTTVREEEQVVDPPLTIEEVEVERVPIGRVVEAPTPIRQEGDTTIVPVFEEVLVVEKRLLLKEEVRLVRRRREERRPQRVTVRREEARVERGPGNQVGEKGASP